MIYRELKDSGFEIRKNELIPPNLRNKDELRRAHRPAKNHLLLENKEWILENEDSIIDNFASGKDINPSEIYPKLVLVDDDEKSRLFRYASYLWSVPLSNGFGRRIRYLVMDESNNKLIGIFGMTDPVIGLKVRDDWVGWDRKQKEKMLWHVMDLYAFGAVAPYNYLLGGKLVATMSTSNEVRRTFNKKYSSGRTEINRKNYKSRRGGLALVTTTGAFGESSILDRLKTYPRPLTSKIKPLPKDRLLWQFIGFTQGWGTFHLNNGIATKMVEYLKSVDDDILRRNRFGDGPNWKMRVIRRSMDRMGLDYKKYGKHGVKRGFYAAPLAKNFKEFLKGDNKKLIPYNQTIDNLFSFFRERYLLPRAQRDLQWQEFRINQIRLSNKMKTIK